MENDLTTSSAAVAYFTLLALFPTLILVLAIGNQLVGPETVENFVFSQVVQFLPGAESFVRHNLESITRASTGVVVSCIIAMLWAASWIFTVIEKALNRIWGSYPRSFLHGRAVNFAVMSLVWLLLGVSTLFTAVGATLRAFAERFPAGWITTLSSYAGNVIVAVASVALTIVLFTVIFKWLPNARVSFLEAIPGAVLAGTLWEGAKFGFAHLLPYFHYELLYGSVGAAIALLSWAYLSSAIMLFGAQFTALLHREHLFEPSRATASSADLIVNPKE
jgi:YihY family inner membrane protein